MKMHMAAYGMLARWLAKLKETVHCATNAHGIADRLKFKTVKELTIGPGIILSWEFLGPYSSR